MIQAEKSESLEMEKEDILKWPKPVGVSISF